MYFYADEMQQATYILIGEDDADDRFLLQAAFEENGFSETLRFADNGVDLLSVLSSPPLDEEERPILPKFILLDLNMPKKDGREVLREVKADPALRQIPIIIFSTTSNEQEMRRCYELGANSYITKPSSFDNLLKTVASLRSYWLSTVDIPSA